MATLIVHRPDGSASAHPLDRDRITIGRRADNDICLAYPPVSAEHAVVITIGGDSFLEDLGSTNGTLVNGERIARHFLRDHDEIDVGRVAITYLARDDDGLAAPAPASVSRGEVAPREELRSIAVPEKAVEDPAPVSDPDEAADEAGAPADELLADLMESRPTATAALDLSPTLTVVRSDQLNGNTASAAVLAEARITILTGPHAGEATPMDKAQFVFGRPGVSVAAIRRSSGVYRLVPLAGETPPVVNGGEIDRAGVELAFGDTIEVAGVRLRFERRV